LLLKDQSFDSVYSENIGVLAAQRSFYTIEQHLPALNPTLNFFCLVEKPDR